MSPRSGAPRSRERFFVECPHNAGYDDVVEGRVKTGTCLRCGQRRAFAWRLESGEYTGQRPADVFEHDPTVEPNDSTVTRQTGANGNQ